MKIRIQLKRIKTAKYKPVYSTNGLVKNVEKFFGTKSHICQKVTSATNVLRICLVIEIRMNTR